MSTRGHPFPLLIVALVLGFIVVAADTVLNRPRERSSDSNGPVIITSDPSFSEHYWTVRGPGGNYGLVGFSQSRYRPRSTDVQLGPVSFYVGLSIYAVAGFAACLVIAAGGVAGGFIGRHT